MTESIGKTQKIWSPSKDLSPRLKALRGHYFDFQNRSFKNEVMPFTTGDPWDMVYARYAWGVVPEVVQFMPTFEDSLLACAKTVDLEESFWNDPIILRRANFFSKVVRDYLPVEILDNELIVGGQFNTALSFSLKKSEIKAFKKVQKKYFEKLKWVNEMGLGNAGATSGHLIPDYKRVIEVGFAGILDEIARLKETAETTEHLHLLEAMKVCLEGGIALSHRYADMADKMAKNELDKNRALELKEIARICRTVPENPPKTFHESLQALWMTHMLVMVAESYPGPGVSPGRVDQYLFPLYKADIESGKITREFAFELLGSWFMKHNYAYDFQGRVGNNNGINSSFGQLITIGGIDKDYNDASNDLTWLILDVIDQMNVLEPKPNIRLHDKTPDDLLKRICNSISIAQGAPFLLNFDENSIDGLRWQGLPEDQLWDYAPVGCLENTLQGNDRSQTVDVNANLAKAIELACFNGRDLASGKVIGPMTGDPRRYTTFDQFLDAVKQQTSHIIKILSDLYEKTDVLRSTYLPTPYLSAHVRGCAKSGKDITASGAEHNFITVEGMGFATAADSLLAIKHLVFDTEKISMKDVIKAIRDNFKGHEKIQAMLKNKAPKYGNDDNQADELAREFSRFWTEEVFKRTSPTGKRYRGGYLSWNYWIAYAPKVAATPDGRPRGQFLSNGIGATNGVDRNGPTAAIKSVGKLDLESAPNGASHTMSFSPAMLRDDEHIEKMAAMLRAYGKTGGTALQVNVVDSETLRQAQANPKDYSNLLVRVTGYNAYFTTLGKEIQDEMIARSDHDI